jgi:hypothetical protein
MGLKFNPTTGKLDLVNPGIGTPDTTTDNAIVTWDGITGEAIQQATSNIPTISDTGIASFPEDDFVQSERIGASSYVSGVRSVVFGYSAGGTQLIVAVGYSARANQNDSVAIGAFCAVNAIRSVAIGRSANVGTSGTSGVAIGYLANVSNSEGVGIGQGTSVSGFRAFALGTSCSASGDYAMSVGRATSVTESYGASFGESITNAYRSFSFGSASNPSADNQLIFGGNSNTANYFNDIYLGAGPLGLNNTNLNLIGDININFANSETDITDRSVSHVMFKAPAGTGTGTGGSLIFEVAPATITGSTLNPYITALEINQSGEVKLSGAVSKPITTVSANTTLDSSHYTVLVDTTAGDITITLPPSVSGRVYNIKKKTGDTNKVIVSGAIDDDISAEITTQYESITVQEDGTDWWII